MQTLDAASSFKKDFLKDDQLILMYAALCHDLGKAKTTKQVNGMWKTFNHENAGVPITKKFLKRITRKKDIIESVCKLIKYHMLPAQFIKYKAKPYIYKRWANKLAPVTLKMLGYFAWADQLGRNSKKAPVFVKEFLDKAEQAAVLIKTEEPVLLDRDLIQKGVKPGPKIGRLLKRAYKIQPEEGIKDKTILLKRLSL
jgi:tRNA nucleotidyltransferase (CCA-adding enzyme)